MAHVWERTERLIFKKIREPDKIKKKTREPDTFVHNRRLLMLLHILYSNFFYVHLTLHDN